MGKLRLCESLGVNLLCNASRRLVVASQFNFEIEESFYVRDETNAPSICVFCKLAITPDQRPTVTLDNGEEIHIECYNAWDRTQPRPTEQKAWRTLKRLKDHPGKNKLRVYALA